ncbi:MAG TPA: hypothetical protein VGX00_04440 [Thermoplasmata archaeon]|nr:hypothetical protein [Thermoplasmata archaeon]
MARRYPDEWGDDDYVPPPADRRPRRGRDRAPVRKRSNAAIPVALAVFLAGIILGQYSVLIPGLLGIGLVYVAISFLSSRLNPFSLSFYLTVKPSWLAIGTLAFVGLVLVGVAYGYYVSGLGPFAPGVPRLP